MLDRSLAGIAVFNDLCGERIRVWRSRQRFYCLWVFLWHSFTSCKVSLEAFYLTASNGRDRVICVCSRNQLWMVNRRRVMFMFTNASRSFFGRNSRFLLDVISRFKCCMCSNTSAKYKPYGIYLIHQLNVHDTSLI